MRRTRNCLSNDFTKYSIFGDIHMPNESKLFSIIATVLEMEQSEISDASSPDNISDWDSLKGLLMVTELEEGFNVKFSMYEIMNVRTVKDIKDALSLRGITF